jgi:hypothetical protein
MRRKSTATGASSESKTEEGPYTFAGFNGFSAEPRGWTEDNRKGGGGDSGGGGGGCGGCDIEPTAREGVAVVDNVFTPAALNSLLRLCQESTTYFDLKVAELMLTLIHD